MYPIVINYPPDSSVLFESIRHHRLHFTFPSLLYSMFVLLISKTLITYTRTHNFERTLFCNFSMLRWRFWLESLHTHIRLHTQFYCREPMSQSQSRLRIYLQVIFVYSTNLRIGRFWLVRKAIQDQRLISSFHTKFNILRNLPQPCWSAIFTSSNAHLYQHIYLYTINKVDSCIE